MEANGAAAACIPPRPPVHHLGCAAGRAVGQPGPGRSWLLVGLGALLLMGYGWARVMRDRVTAGGGRSARGSSRATSCARFTLINGILPVLWAHVRDRSEVPGCNVDRVEAIGGQAERRWTMAGLCQRQGVPPRPAGPGDERPALAASSASPRHYSEVDFIMVYRGPHTCPTWNCAGVRRAAPSRRDAPSRGPFRWAACVGTPRAARCVHWPATAHRGDIMVLEFDREPSGDLWLVVDLDATGAKAESQSRGDQGMPLSLAASLAARVPSPRRTPR